MKSFGILGHHKRAGVVPAVQLVLKWIKENGLKYVLCEEIAELIDEKGNQLPREKMHTEIDCLLSLGGDGTMLAAARAVGQYGIPIFGINVGSLGFLTEATTSEIITSLEAIKAGRFIIDERMALRVECEGLCDDHLYALNDIVFDNGADTRLVKLDLFLNDKFVCSYNADGLIIATPTGSTAYNLAAGGPVLHPQLDAIIACPICPHSLTIRPILFSNDAQIVVRLAAPDIDGRLTIDGQVNLITPPAADVLIRRASHRVMLIRLHEYDFFNILRTKLHLGARPLTNDNA